MNIVIIGNGIAGTNAARFIRKQRDYTITMVSDETLQPFSRTALMYIYMGHLRAQDTQLYEDHFWTKNRIHRVKARVVQVQPEQKKVLLDDGSSLPYDKLIIASGSRPNKFGWPGQELEGVQGLYHLHDLERMERHSTTLKHAVIVGGGLIGIEMAEMFHSRNIPVTLLVRESSFWNSVLPTEESAMVNRHIQEHALDLRLNTELREIVDDGQGRVAAVITKEGERIACGFVGLTVGVSPNIDFLRDSGIELNKGVLVDEFLETSLPDIFAVGDCAEIRRPLPGRKPIEAVWYTGRIMGQTVARTICGSPTSYDPGLWFNSAKFLDIEYQVYGDIPARPAPGVESVYWEHPDGKKSIRINYQTEDRAVTGFNLMGIRYRHEVCEKWIRERAAIEVVLRQLALANFDPEFSRMFEAELIKQYNQTQGTELRLESKRKLNLVNLFLKINP